MKRSKLPIALILAAWPLAACEASFFGLDAEAGVIEIAVTRGPINPVEREGQVNEAPVQGARIMARTGSMTRTTATDGLGRARFRVPAGRWIVVVQTCPGALGIPHEQVVDVMAGGFAAVRFSCDTGIR